jgi:hypothetical protein
MGAKFGVLEFDLFFEKYACVCVYKIKGKGKGKFHLEQATKAQRRSRDIALLFP